MPRRYAIKTSAAALVALVFLAFAPLAAAQGLFSNNSSSQDSAFDYYILALSWSPTWCADKGDARNADQCEPGANPGFVVHGLWPAQANGTSLTDCGPQGRNPTRMALDIAADVFPSIGLARHQWRKHGVCSGLDPSAYFTATKEARARIIIPAPLQAPQQDLQTTPQSVERVFADANPGLRADMIQIACRRDQLTEVRLCLSRDLKSFATCPAIQRSECRTRNITIPAGR